MTKDILNNKRNSRLQTITATLIVAFIILMTSGFKCIYWNSTYEGWLRNVILFGFFYLCGILQDKRAAISFPKGSYIHDAIAFFVYHKFIYDLFPINLS